MTNITIISMIFTLSSIICPLIYYRLSKNKENVEFKIKRGEVCYNCKQDIETYAPSLMSGLEELCKPCKRDILLESCLNNSWYKYKIIKNYKKIGMCMILASALLNCLAFKWKIFGIAGGVLLLFGNIIFYKGLYNNLREKPIN